MVFQIWNNNYNKIELGMKLLGFLFMTKFVKFSLNFKQIYFYFIFGQWKWIGKIINKKKLYFTSFLFLF